MKISFFYPENTPKKASYLCGFWLSFPNKGQLPIWNLNPNYSRLSQNVPITHQEFEPKFPLFETLTWIFFSSKKSFLQIFQNTAYLSYLNFISVNFHKNQRNFFGRKVIMKAIVSSSPQWTPTIHPCNTQPPKPFERIHLDIKFNISKINTYDPNVMIIVYIELKLRQSKVHRIIAITRRYKLLR